MRSQGGGDARGRTGRRLARALLIAVAVSGTLLAHAALPSDRRSAQGEQWIPDPAVVKAASLGFHNVLADYHWITAVQIVGDSRSDPARHGPLLGKLIDVVTTLDPWVDHPYRFAAIWMTDSLESVRKADAATAGRVHKVPISRRPTRA